MKNVSGFGITKTAIVAAILLWPLASTAQESKVQPRPELPYFDWNACPFEGCVYRLWTAKESMPLYDTWQAKRQKIGQLAAGEKVVGETGVVITYKPGRVRIDRDLPQQHLRRGDVLG